MKKLMLCALVVLLSLPIIAQDVTKPKCKVRYQGEVSLGLGLGIPYPMPLCEIHTIHGIRVGDYFSTGIGVGFDFPSLAAPVYLNLRGYLPVSQKTRLFLGLDIGVGVGEPLAFYVAPAFGANFKVSRKSSINASLVYKSYVVDKYSGLPGGLVIRVGFQF